jgi:hypothetical protein
VSNYYAVNNYYMVARSLEIYGNPNGIAAYSPGLLYSATLGRLHAIGPNPNGVASLAAGVMNNETWRRCVTAPEARRNPFGVATNEQLAVCAAPSPRVAEYGNPGLMDATPFGVVFNHAVVEKDWW